MNEVSTEVNEVADEVYADRVIRNGLVAVLYSPGYGAGWSTWASEDIRKDVMFDPAIVELVEKEKWEELKAFVALKYPTLYTGGLEDLQVEWVPEGTAFRIDDYDGNESIEFRDMTEWIIA